MDHFGGWSAHLRSTGIVLALLLSMLQCAWGQEMIVPPDSSFTLLVKKSKPGFWNFTGSHHFRGIARVERDPDDDEELVVWLIAGDTERRKLPYLASTGPATRIELQDLGVAEEVLGPVEFELFKTRKKNSAEIIVDLQLFQYQIWLDDDQELHSVWLLPDR